MADCWPSAALETVADLSGGYAFKSEEYSPLGRFVLRTLNIGDDGRVNRDQAAYIPLDACAPYARFELQVDDVLFVMVGATLGKIGLVAERDLPALLNQNMWRVRAIDGAVEKRFLFYAFKHCAAEGLAGASGSARLFVRRDDYRRLKIPLPARKFQKCIAAILGALDDKINLNRRMNETLEAMARAIFKDWFVDFGPTRAKMEGRAPYLASEIWALFPDRLNDKGKPEGWNDFRLYDLITQSKGSVSPSAYPDEIFEHYSLPSYDAGQSPALDLGSTIKSNKTPIPSGVVLLSKLNPEISRIWLPDPKTQLTQVASTEFLSLMPKGFAGSALVYSILRSDPFKAMLEGMVTGTSKSHQRVSPPALLSQTVLVATPKLATAFERMASPLFDQQLANRGQTRTLAATRDLLLPKLMSGEIRVKDAEKAVEAVA